MYVNSCLVALHQTYDSKPKSAMRRYLPHKLSVYIRQYKFNKEFTKNLRQLSLKIKLRKLQS